MSAIEKLKKLIEQTNLKYKEFARKAGIPYTTLLGILERGPEYSSYKNLEKISKALNISVEDLFYDPITFTNKPNSIITIGRGGEKKEYSIPEQDFKLVQQIIDKLTNKE